MEENRYKDISKANISGILGNVFLLIIKFIIGFLSKSQAMISVQQIVQVIFFFTNEQHW